MLLKAAEETVMTLQDLNCVENISNNDEIESAQENILVNTDVNEDDIHGNEDVVNEVDNNGNEDTVVNVESSQDRVVNEDETHGSEDIFSINDILSVIQNDDETDKLPDGMADIEEGEKGKRSKRPNSLKWTRNLNKGKRERGEEYAGIKKTGDKWQYDIIKPSKKMKPHCDCSMSKKSSKINCNLLTETCKHGLINEFWKQMNWEQRRTHIQAMVDSDRTKDLKNQQNNVSRRNSSLFYHL